MSTETEQEFKKGDRVVAYGREVGTITGPRVAFDAFPVLLDKKVKGKPFTAVVHEDQLSPHAGGLCRG